MKVRNGFVSNSSSSSFLIDARKYSEYQVEKIIDKALEVEELKYGEKHSRDDICTLYTMKSGSPMIEEIKEAGYSFHQDTSYYDFPCIRVDSIGSNSIPWGVQEVLEDFALFRHHWG